MSKEYTFTVPAGLNPGACVADEGSRWSATGNVMLHNNLAIATDGRCLTVLPLKGETPPYPCIVDGDSIKADAKHDATVSVNGQLKRTVRSKVSLHELPLQEGRFPPAQQIMPNVNDYTVLRINAEILMQLAKAIAPGRVLDLLLPPANDDGVIMKPLAVVSYDSTQYYSGLGEAVGIGLIVPLSQPKDTPTTKQKEDFAAIAKKIGNREFRIEPHKDEEVPVAAPTVEAVAA